MTDEQVTDVPEVPQVPQWPMEKGRAIAIPVGWRDILPWTKPACRSCEGRGVLTKLVGPERKRSTSLCGCAIKRFRKVQVCTVKKGQLFAVEPWVAVHPETIAEVVRHMEKEQAEDTKKNAAAKADQVMAQLTKEATNDGPTE